MKKQWLRLLVGAFGCLFTAVNPLSAQTWTLTSAPTTAWTSVASSADGSKLVAAANGGGIYTSTDSGATWTLTSAPNARWISVASSADGTKLAAVLQGDVNRVVYISTNSGTIWYISYVVPVVPIGMFYNWSAVCMSADGTRLAVAANWMYFGGWEYEGVIFISTNMLSNLVWTGWQSGFGFSGYLSWSSVASSVNGAKLVAATADSLIYTATVSLTGASWTQATNAPTGAGWTSVASSADGTKLVVVGNGSIYTSPDSGVTWMLTSAPTNAWTSVASSADGTRLVAAAANSLYSIYTSTNSGATWTQATNGPSGAVWASVASSADGSKLVAAVNGGGIYTSQTTPAPVLNIAPSSNNLAFSWIVPSTSFVLQQNSDLTTTNWADVTNTPALNLTNLQNQVALPLPAGNAFYRLKTP